MYIDFKCDALGKVRSAFICQIYHYKIKAPVFSEQEEVKNNVKNGDLRINCSGSGGQ